MPVVTPELFGALGNGTHDDGPAIQSALNALASSSDTDGVRTLKLGRGKKYLTNQTINVQPTVNNSLRITGAGVVLDGSTILAGPALPASAPVMLVQAGTGMNEIVDVHLEAFRIEPCVLQQAPLLLNSQHTALHINGTINSLKKNVISEVFFGEFQTGIRLTNTRLWLVTNSCVWAENTTNANGVIIEATGSGTYCGDFDFADTQFALGRGKNTRCVSISSNGGTVTGVGFSNTIFYRGDTGLKLSAMAGGRVGDIWLNPRCQFDGELQLAGSSRGVYAVASGSNSLIDNINILGVYFRGYPSDVQIVDMRAEEGAILREVTVSQNWFSDGSGGALYLKGVKGAVVADNRLMDIGRVEGSLYAMMDFDNCQSFTCSGNSALRTGVHAYWGMRINATCDYFSVTGNQFYNAVDVGNIENLTSASSLRVVANNA
jgi:hypothetical protein